ncbi:ABC transporter permease [Streptomyces sp. SM11]|uniref:ABC transporter permease n=1 Tax=Streptomyces sp. SM11 TaxID=565557 RepID=UPI000CD4B67D|nr:ABC transporter permease [Streptomyces sp. SM11]
MTSTTIPAPHSLRPSAQEQLTAILTTTQQPPRPSALSASMTFAWRAVLKIRHVPEQLIDVTLFPVVMTLMFTNLFGGALAGSPREYLQFLLPGMLVMSVVLTTMNTGVGLKADIDKGAFDRFRTLPVWRPSALVGSLLGDMARYLTASATILLVGLAMGFRPAGGPLGVLAGVGLLTVFSFAFSWIWTTLGLLMRTEKSVMGASMLVMFPLNFLSNILVSPDTLPAWLQAFVDVNPIAHLVTAVRGLMAGTPDAAEITWTLVAGAAIVTVFGTLTMRLYNRR